MIQNAECVARAVEGVVFRNPSAASTMRWLEHSTGKRFCVLCFTAVGGPGSVTIHVNEFSVCGDCAQVCLAEHELRELQK